MDYTQVLPRRRMPSGVRVHCDNPLCPIPALRAYIHVTPNTSNAPRCKGCGHSFPHPNFALYEPVPEGAWPLRSSDNRSRQSTSKSMGKGTGQPLIRPQPQQSSTIRPNVAASYGPSRRDASGRVVGKQQDLWPQSAKTTCQLLPCCSHKPTDLLIQPNKSCSATQPPSSSSKMPCSPSTPPPGPPMPPVQKPNQTIPSSQPSRKLPSSLDSTTSAVAEARSLSASSSNICRLPSSPKSTSRPTKRNKRSLKSNETKLSKNSRRLLMSSAVPPPVPPQPSPHPPLQSITASSKALALTSRLSHKKCSETSTPSLVQLAPKHPVHVTAIQASGNQRHSSSQATSSAQLTKLLGKAETTPGQTLRIVRKMLLWVMLLVLMNVSVRDPVLQPAQLSLQQVTVRHQHHLAPTHMHFLTHSPSCHLQHPLQYQNLRVPVQAAPDQQQVVPRNQLLLIQIRSQGNPQRLSIMFVPKMYKVFKM